MPLSSRRTPSLEDLGVERADWGELGPEFYRVWGRPGGRHDPEHLTVYGKSGSGKTYFVREVIATRARLRGTHVVYVATKRADAEIMKLHNVHGWPIIDTWPPGYGENQVLYWARAKGLSAEFRIPQRAKVKLLMDKLWTANSNTMVVWDELSYIQGELKLGPELTVYYREGRSNGITNVALMQRPSGVTRSAHSEAHWTVAFPPKDADDRKRVAEVLGDRARFQAALDLLDRQRHEFLIRHDRSGEVYVSHLLPPRRAASVDTRHGRGGVPSPQR
jgi:hypothetical protein